MRKKAKSKSEKIREVAKKVLRRVGGTMKISELFSETVESLGFELRTDFFKEAILVNGSRINVVDSVASLTSGKERGKMREKKESSKKLTVEEFTLLAIQKLSKPPHKAIHVVYSGFNVAFRQYFPDLDPVEEVKALAEKKKVSLRPAKGGVVIFAGSSAATVGGDTTLGKMGLK